MSKKTSDNFAKLAVQILLTLGGKEKRPLKLKNLVEMPLLWNVHSIQLT